MLKFVRPICLFLFCLIISSNTSQAKSTYLAFSGLKANSNTVDIERQLSSAKISLHLSSGELNDVAIQGQGYQEINLDGLVNSKAPSLAQLPFKAILINQHPQDIGIKLTSRKQIVYKDVRPAPFLEKPCRCNEKRATIFDQKAYEAGTGESHFTLEYMGDFRGTPITRLLLYPATFADNKFKIAPDLEVKIVLKKRQTGVTGKRELKVGSIEDIYWQERPVTSESSKMLIIYNDSLQEGAEALGAFKASQGFSIQSLSLSQLGMTASQVKEKLHSLYLDPTSKMDFVMILGHEALFPTFYVNTQFDQQTPSDLPYFTMSGADDFIPDVYYGRLAANSNDEILSYIQKLRDHDSDRPALNSTPRFLAMASNEGLNPSDEQYIEMMVAPLRDGLHFRGRKLVQGQEESNPAQVNQEFSNGLQWVNYIGHGSGFAWPSLTQRYEASHIVEMNHQKIRPVVIDVACQNGRFSYERRMGERLINESSNGRPLGALAYYGGSVDISWDPPAIMAIGISQAVKESANQKTSLGEILLKGQLYLLQKHSVKEDVIHNFSWYHLQGDPSLVMSF